MNRGSVFAGVLAVAFGAALGGAEAKLVRYEIDGQRYSYSTNNRQQAREARQRIQAAKQAAASRAQADAERAANPLVGVFGSPTQASAAEAQARAQQVLAQPTQAADDATSSVKGSRAERRRARAEVKAERARARREAQAEARRSRSSRTAQSSDDEPAGKAKASAKRQQRMQETKAEPAKLQPVAPERPVAADPKRAGESVVSAPNTQASTSGPVPEPARPPNSQKPVIKSVSFDLSSGIKTVRMTDGSVHEEPIDSGTISKLGSEPAGASLTNFVDQVRKTPGPQ